MPDQPPRLAIDLARRLHGLADARARQLLENDGIRQPQFGLLVQGTTEDRRAHALAMLRACTELIGDLQRTADQAATTALASGASYSAVGAARGISRQGARQRHQKRYQRDQLEQKARREARDAELARRGEDPYGEAYADLDYDEEDGRWNPWPPRPWRFRAPAGQWTVTLVGGPLDSQTFRVPVGDDAYPYVDHTDVFGRRHARYARYSPAKPGGNQYRFTGEFFVRWDR